MRRFGVFCAAIAAFGTGVEAGQVSGRVLKEGRPLRGVMIQIECGGPPFVIRSNDEGYYTEYVGHNGMCRFFVEGGNDGLDLFISRVPETFNLELDGQGRLKRR